MYSSVSPCVQVCLSVSQYVSNALVCPSVSLCFLVFQNGIILPLGEFESSKLIAHILQHFYLTNVQQNYEFLYSLSYLLYYLSFIKEKTLCLLILEVYVTPQQPAAFRSCATWLHWNRSGRCTHPGHLTSGPASATTASQDLDYAAATTTAAPGLAVLLLLASRS